MRNRVQVLILCFDVFRHKETWKGGETVKKILNGGGSLSLELIKDTSIFFYKAKLISAYGKSILTQCFLEEFFY